MFGNSVSISGDTIIVGSFGDDEGESSSGSAYVYVRDGAEWSLQANLTASDPVENDYFGYSVSVSGDTAVIGAVGNDDNGTESGSAYVFYRDDDEWLQEATLTASDAAEGDRFGFSVSVSGDTVIVGAYRKSDGGDFSGAAYIFVRDEDGWSQEAKLTASDPASEHFFGYSVSVSGDTAIVGAVGDGHVGEKSGAAYVFSKDGDGWSQEAKLIASDPASDHLFGYSVSVVGDTALVGAPGDGHGGENSGSAYFFYKDGDGWSQQAKLTAPEAAADDLFGNSVSVSGDTAIIGAHSSSDDGQYSGSAYVFARDVDEWSQQAKLTASDATAGDLFGYSVSVSGDTVIVGAYQDDGAYINSGSAYIFSCV